MPTWMKKVFSSEGVTEYPPGPELERLRTKFQQNAAVYLCLDVSGSMKSHLEQARRGAQAFVREAQSGGYHVGIVLWSHEVEGTTGLSRTTEEADRLLATARTGGATRLVPALEAASRRLLAFDAVDRVIAIFGDGLLHDEDEAKVYSRELASRGIRIITLGLGEDVATSLSALDTDHDAPVRVAHGISLSSDITSMSASLRRRDRR